MKKYHILIVALAAVLMISCDKETVEIDSLQVFGDEFYQGQGVQVAMSVKTSDQEKNYYEWSCEEGYFPTSQQGYATNKWYAPAKNGEYTITCTVHCGGTTATRQAKIRVNGVFFDRFSTLSVWAAADNSNVAVKDYRLEADVKPANALTDSCGTVTRELTIKDFMPPLSMTADVGIVGTGNNNDPKYPVASNNPLWDNNMSFALTGGIPAYEVAPNYYISGLTIQWWPTTHMLQGTLPYYDYTGAFQQIESSAFEAMIRVNYVYRADPSTGRPEDTGYFSIPFSTNALKYDAEQSRNIGLSIDENYVVRVFANDAEIFSTTDLQTWRAAHDNAPLVVAGCFYQFPSKTKVFMDNLIFNDSIELLH